MSTSPQAPLPDNPFYSEHAANRESNPPTFWKPGTSGERIVGRLTSVRESTKRDKNGNLFAPTATFHPAITYSDKGSPILASGDGEPLSLGVTLNLADRVTPEDVGAWFQITYTGNVNTGQPSPARTFDVRVVTAGSPAARQVVETMRQDKARLDAKGATDALDHDDSDLPF